VSGAFSRRQCVHAHHRGPLQHTTIHCNTQQRIATHCNTLPHTAFSGETSRLHGYMCTRTSCIHIRKVYTFVSLTHSCLLHILSVHTLHGSKDPQNAFNCRSLSTKEPLIIGHF